MKKLLSLIFFFLFLSRMAMAGILFEPMLGFRVHGDTSYQSQSFSTTQFDISGRLGYIHEQYVFALEQIISTWSFHNRDYTGPSLAMTFGYTLGIVRFYTALIPLSHMKNDADNAKIKGSGFSLGFNIGYSKMPNLFFKYRYISYDEFDPDGGPTIELSGEDQVRPKVFIFGISIPFEF